MPNFMDLAMGAMSLASMFQALASTLASRSAVTSLASHSNSRPDNNYQVKLKVLELNK